jgi:hypothetical protein
MKKTMIIGFSLLLQIAAIAEVIPASSLNRQDVVDAIALAQPYDIVQLPAGESTWSTPVSITKNIHIRGMGTNETRLIKISTSTSANLFSFGSSEVRISHIHFRYDGGDTGNGIIGWGNSQRFRIDNNLFQNEGDKSVVGCRGYAVSQGPHSRGVIHHNQFIRCKVHALGELGSTTYSQWSWFNITPELGGPSGIYIENNNFWTSLTTNNCIDSNDGGEYVFRFNYVDGPYVEAHGSQLQNNIPRRGVRRWEIYGNAITGDKAFYQIFIRGGYGVCFSNQMYRISGGASNVSIDSRRAADAHVDGTWLHYDGREPYDPIQGEGTHQGGSGTTLSDPSKNWQNLVNTKGVGYAVWNMRTMNRALIATYTPTTITGYSQGKSLESGSGSSVSWVNGDPYIITYGYKDRDGIGAYKDTALGNNTAFTKQIVQPSYFWDNFRNGAAYPAYPRNQVGSWCLEGRDYINGPMPGYVPYTYPHPHTAYLESGDPPDPDPDPDPPPVPMARIAMAEGSYSVAESIGSVLIYVNRTIHTNNAVSVSYRTLNGTAEAGIDFAASLGTLNFAIDEIQKSIPVTIYDNGTPQSNRAFYVEVYNPVDCELGVNTVSIVTIMDDDVIVRKKPRLRTKLTEPK